MPRSAAPPPPPPSGGMHSPSTTSTGSLSKSSSPSSSSSLDLRTVPTAAPTSATTVPPGTPPTGTSQSRKSHTGSGGGSYHHRLPKLFVLIELNQWSKVEERVKRHPREAAIWATVRKGRAGAATNAAGGTSTGSGASSPERSRSATAASELLGTPSSSAGAGASGGTGGTGGTPERQISTVKCKALHHACQKLRSVHNLPPPSNTIANNKDNSDEEEEEFDPYVAACKAIIALVEAHPKAAGERESRHGCLPLHLAAFGMGGGNQQQQPQQQSMITQSYGSTASIAGASPSRGGVMQGGGGLLSRPGIVGRETSAPVDLDEIMSGDEEESSSAATSNMTPGIIPPSTPSSRVTAQSASAPSSPAMDVDEMADTMFGGEEGEGPLQTCKSDPISLAGSAYMMAESLTAFLATSSPSAKPPKMPSRGSKAAHAHGGHHKRGHSHDTHDFSLMGMSQVIHSETHDGNNLNVNMVHRGQNHQHLQGQQNNLRRPAPISTQERAQSAPVKSVSASQPAVSYVVSTTTSSTRRDHYSLLVLNALLDAYPRAVKTDSEGGRLPLHTAISGQATAKAIRTLVRAYPDAARQRTKDGYLPLHLAAHWGVSSLDVVSALLKAYPDAILGRNRWERTPLEEALVMAGENGRVNQVGLVRALRRHPSYWAGAGASAELSAGVAALNLGHGGGGGPMGGGGGGMSDLQGLLSPESGGGAMQHSSTLVDVDASFDEEDSDEYGGMDDHDAAASGGFMSRISPRMHMSMSKPKPAAARSVTEVQSDAAKALAAKTDLATLVRMHSFSSIPHRLRLYPNEASQSLHATVRGGYPAKVTPLYLACEYNPTVEVVDLLIEMFKDGCGVRKVPGGQLPLHGACTWNAASGVVGMLLASYPAAAQQRDDLSNLPLHCACFSGTSVDVIEALLKAYPRGVWVRNGQGSAPSDIVRRLRHPNRNAVLRVLGRYEEEIAKRRREVERSNVGKPSPLQQDQRQESVETTLRSGSSPQNAMRRSGKKPQPRTPASVSDSPSVRQQKKVDVRASGPSNDDASDDGMLWV